MSEKNETQLSSSEINTSFPEKEVSLVSEQYLDSASITSSALTDVDSDIIIKSRIKYGSRFSACKGMLMEYSKITTVHGIRYIFEFHRPIYEKLYWLVLTCASALIAILFIWNTYLKWQDSPVIMGFDETLVPVHKIPFPTITICPEIKTERNVFDFTKISRQVWNEFELYDKFENIANISQEHIENLAATLQICDLDVAQRFASLIPKDMSPNVTQTLVSLSISKNETLPFCKWNGRFYLCHSIYNFVATDDGICYQFNGMHNKDLYRDERFLSNADPQIPDFNIYYDKELPLLNNITGDWSLETGYVEQGFNAYPQRTVFSSVHNALFAVLNGLEHNFDYDCRSFKQGYKVFLNSPESVPSTTGNYILVPHGFEVMVSVLPQYIMSTSNLHEFSAEKRQCYFDDERNLRFFRFYSQSNCQVECLANFTITKCGCVKFWMPKPLDVPVCGLSELECFNVAQKELQLIIENQTMTHTTDTNSKIMCDCMPGCTSLEYNFEISRARYDLAKTVQAFREEFELKDFVASRLSVYFKEHQFTAIKRTTLFGMSTLIANCGGIFGLFMGISILSFIELFYFLSLRVFSLCRLRRLTKKRLMKQIQ